MKEPEQLNLVEEVRKIMESKQRTARAPILNPHHMARAYSESDGDFYKVLSWLCGHYNYAFKPQQVKNAYARLNKELEARGFQPLKFAPARKNEAYLDTFAAEWASKGLLKKADSKPEATPKKPSTRKAESAKPKAY